MLFRSRLFVPGKEIETYDNLEEAVEKVNFYAANPDKAIDIGRKAQERTIKDYNYKNYVIQILGYFNHYLK